MDHGISVCLVVVTLVIQFEEHIIPFRPTEEFSVCKACPPMSCSGVRNYRIRHHDHSLALAELLRIKGRELGSVIILVDDEFYRCIAFHKDSCPYDLAHERFPQRYLARIHIHCRGYHHVLCVLFKRCECPFLLADRRAHVFKIFQSCT